MSPNNIFSLFSPSKKRRFSSGLEKQDTGALGGLYNAMIIKGRLIYMHKSGQKLHALARVAKFMNQEKLDCKECFYIV